MSNRNQRAAKPPHCKAGFTLPEALAAMMITGLACSALLYAVSGAVALSHTGGANTRAMLLAQAIMDEISACQWADPDDVTHWGAEPGETETNRLAFDDIDDYDGLNETPPRTRDGQAFDEWQKQHFPAVQARPYANLRWEVNVRPVDPADLVRALSPGASSPYRRVTVRVTAPHQTPQELTRVFSDSAVNGESAAGGGDQ
jgi:hypothetical protein